MSTPTWTQLFPANPPSPRGLVQAALDEVTFDVLLFGGADGGGFISPPETFKWDGSDYTELFPVNVPTATGVGGVLWQNALGWDGINDRPMLVAKNSGAGGSTTGAFYRFWYFDWVTPDWVEVVPSTIPTGGTQFDARLTWSPNLGALVMQVGSGGTAWLWDGTDFTDSGECIPEPAQPPCQNVSGFSLTHDPNIGKLVEYGGSTLSVTHWTGTSLFDGAYALQSPAANPGPRADMAGKWAAFSDSCGGVVVYGGDDTIGNDTRTLGYIDGGAGYNWVDLAPASRPTVTRDNSMWTDAVGKVFLFGGFEGALNYSDETWMFECVPDPPSPVVFQRVMGIPVEIDDNGTETVRELLVGPAGPAP